MKASERYLEMADAGADRTAAPAEAGTTATAERPGNPQFGFVMGWELDDLSAADGDGRPAQS